MRVSHVLAWFVAALTFVVCGSHFFTLMSPWYSHDLTFGASVGVGYVTGIVAWFVTLGVVKLISNLLRILRERGPVVVSDRCIDLYRSAP